MLSATGGTMSNRQEASELIEWLKSNTPDDDSLQFLLADIMGIVEREGATDSNVEALRRVVNERKEAMG